MADQMTNDDVSKLLEQLKEHAESAPVSDGTDKETAQSPESVASSDDELRALIKLHFSEEALKGKSGPREDYSFDSEGFVDLSELEEEEPEDDTQEYFEDEPEEEVTEKLSIEIIEDEPEEIFVAETADEEIIDEIVDEIVEETLDTVVDEIVEDIILEEAEEEQSEEQESDEFEQVLFTDILSESESDEDADSIEDTRPEIDEDSLIKEEAGQEDEIIEENILEIVEEEEITEENILEIVEEEEITEEIASEEEPGEPIDLGEIEKERDLGEFDALLAENELVVQEQRESELSQDPETAEAEEQAVDSSEYFDNGEEDLDAVDIALMMALGGEGELTQTMGFEKIRQAVGEYDEHDDSGLSQRDIYGYDGKEFTGYDQAADISKRYAKEKIRSSVRLLGTAFLALVLLIYEMLGWLGISLSGIFSLEKNPVIHVLAALLLMFACAAISYKQIIRGAKDFWNFSSVVGISTIAVIALNIINDVCIIALAPHSAAMIFHSVPAILLFVSVLYDAFEIIEQDGVFSIVSAEGKKYVFEPYGKIKIGDDGSILKEEIIDKDSYFASSTAFVNRYFARTSEPRAQSVAHVISVIVALAASLVIMLVLVLASRPFDQVLAGFVMSASVALFVAAVMSSDFAFFTVYKKLRKINTGIIGKAAASEYGSCDLIYFDDTDVFDTKSVKTKGLKLYDNNEIYRVLYHTQAVFSKIGGPLRSVFEYATTEMAHSRNVVVRDVAGEGISAIVDGKTSVLIGSGSFMKSQGLSPRYSSADIKCEEAGQESIMFIAIGGVLCAKLYVNYKFSRSFDRTVRKLMARGVSIGIRSADPNVNLKWANKLTKYKKSQISVVKPSLKEMSATKSSVDSGIVSAMSTRAAIEALVMCIRLRDFESAISKLRIGVVAVGVLLSLALLLISGVNVITMLVMALYSAAVTSAMILLSYLYTKR